ncbi:Panacea domain-containing protein [Lactiplantibacillus daowaiensis]|uniref:Panacea domain-containing protein n=1 Tax=Lactiplantibacillus daowaiensis TaxID=2559918 RepID=A0ABW1RXL5_9LACO|nr:type II toxin-antitoxin system antitoxin SocA domain-containing protein [Lactiplantibacillus daowaiensis]
MTYTVQQIADWFIASSRAELRLDDLAEPLTKMKLQKLLYFAQGINLAIHNQRLFDSDFYAFAHGPITREIQQRYTGKDLPEFSAKVTEQREYALANNYDEVSKNEAVTEVLSFVWQEYSGYTAAKLRNLSHIPNGPWASVYRRDEKWIKMSDQTIGQFFKKNVVEWD